MLTKDMHKKDVEEFLEGKGDFVKIDYLTRYLKIMPPLEMRKFAYLKLAEVYLGKEMYIDAAKMFRNAAVNSVTFREKREYFIKEAKAYVLGLKFEDSDKALKRAMDEGNSKEKQTAYDTILEFLKKHGETLEKQFKREKASKLYEKLIRMKIKEDEKQEVKEKLLNLYEKLGKIKEYNFLKNLE